MITTHPGSPNISTKASQSFCDIPGLDNSLPRHELPAGTGYHNLQKLYKSTRLELTAMRVGLAKAAPYLPRTFTTRVGL